MRVSKYLYVWVLFIYGSVFAQKTLPVNETIVHDPVMIQQDGVYYLFCTGHGISVFSSKTGHSKNRCLKKPQNGQNL
jgi:arabinan endo-1,5-alpha-L-arabinosidase